MVGLREEAATEFQAILTQHPKYLPALKGIFSSILHALDHPHPNPNGI